MSQRFVEKLKSALSLLVPPKPFRKGPLRIAVVEGVPFSVVSVQDKKVVIYIDALLVTLFPPEMIAGSIAPYYASMYMYDVSCDIIFLNPILGPDVTLSAEEATIFLTLTETSNAIFASKSVFYIYGKKVFKSLFEFISTAQLTLIESLKDPGLIIGRLIAWHAFTIACKQEVENIGISPKEYSELKSATEEQLKSMIETYKQVRPRSATLYESILSATSFLEKISDDIIPLLKSENFIEAFDKFVIGFMNRVAKEAVRRGLVEYEYTFERRYRKDYKRSFIYPVPKLPPHVYI